MSVDVRQKFLEFFRQRGHLVIERQSVVPATADPTLLFINSGMAAMKDYFLGVANPPCDRIVTCQPCLRVGGKHNDLEEVGRTTRHHTFFEMLGNFSFGAYGHMEAVSFAWEFLTKELGVDRARLWVTVHPDDPCALDAWCKVGVTEERILRVPENVWAAGDIGPRGYCTEIFYDFGQDKVGALPDRGDTGERYIEIWNIVLIDRQVGADGAVKQLPQMCVDTGMGLERIEALLRGSCDSYDSNVVRECCALGPAGSISARIIADHARAAVFLIASGVRPGPAGREYVLRRIVRRAFKHQVQSELDNLMQHCAVRTVELMSPFYTNLVGKEVLVREVLDAELQKFQSGWRAATKILDRYTSESARQLSGDIAFKLHDTYGLPIDITESMCVERGLVVDHEGFEAAMAEQRERSRWVVAKPEFSGLERLSKTEFLGYKTLESKATIIGCFDQEGAIVDRLEYGGWVVLDRTPFYATSGGQASDHGHINEFFVSDVQKLADVWLHYLDGGVFVLGQEVYCAVDPTRRAKLRAHHSTIHLLCAALRKLQPNVVFCGSAVMPDKCRLDFTYAKPLDPAMLCAIADTINGWIARDLPCTTQVTTFKDAMDQNASTLPGAEYGDVVRVVSFGDVDIQLCGGTHVKSTAEIVGCAIIEARSISAGTKRIVLRSGLAYAEFAREQQELLDEVCRMLRTRPKTALRDVGCIAAQLGYKS
jgi:alanyl-tRNA synthetase